jgi:DNA-binding transcriptional MerR regulator
MFTIQQVADKTGLTAHTLRYYEKCGLIDPVERDANGYRIYHGDDLGRINMLCCLRRTGMSIADMQTFAQLMRAGDNTFNQRRIVLENHQKQVEAKICDLQDMLKIIQHKIDFYAQAEAS